MEQPRVQILVVVASIKARPFKTEVGKGSTTTSVVCGLVGPNLSSNFINCRLSGYRVEREKG